MNELSIQMNNEPIGCWVGERKVNHLAYADDLTLVSPSLSGLQRLLDCCSDYSERNFIQFNVNKSKTMYIKAGPFSDVTFDDCLLNGSPLSATDSIKYLGHIMKCDTSDDDDLMRHLKYVYSVGNTLIRKFNFCSIHVKLKLFRAYCTNIYSGHLWINYKQSTMGKLNTAYNSVLRRLLWIKRYDESSGVSYSASAMFAKNDVPCLSALLRKNIYRFQCRIISNGNPFLSYLGGINRFTSRIWEFWETKLKPAV